MIRFRLLLAIATLAVSPLVPAFAQTAAEAEASRLVETARQEAATGRHQSALSYYVRAISRDPDNAAILTAAGEEALSTGDSDAAFGFLGRAVTLNPRNAEARAGYGRALVQSARPKDALTLFDQAVRLGMDETRIAGDRGLARDLLGENRRAQRDYRLALTASPRDPVLIQRLGLSLAISGDRDGAVALVQPLTHGASPGYAFRTLAFIHALTGDVTMARKLAMANMPANQADAYTPFFARIAVLDPESKAMAVHLGRLPQTRLARRDEEVPQRVKVPDGDPGAIRSAAVGDMPPPVEREAGRPAKPTRAEEKIAKAKIKEEESKKVVLAKAAAPTPEDFCEARSGRAKTRCEADMAALARRCEGGRRTAECKDYQARLTEAKAETKPRSKAGSKAETGETALSKTPALSPLDECEELTGSKRVQCRADARAIERRCGGASPQKTAECKAYVESRAEAPADKGTAKGKKAKADEDKPKARGKVPERYWVQVASGRNRNDLPKAWTAVKAKSRALLGKRVPYTVPVGNTNRLLIGPFDSTSDARDLVNKLGAAGVSSFPWTSEAGEEVDRLAVK